MLAMSKDLLQEQSGFFYLSVFGAFRAFWQLDFTL